MYVLESIWLVVAIIFSVWLFLCVDLSTIVVTILGYTTVAIVYLGLQRLSRKPTTLVVGMKAYFDPKLIRYLTPI